MKFKYCDRFNQFSLIDCQGLPFKPTATHDFPMVVMCGYSNVGKSTLINAISKKSLAFTAKRAGKTQTVNTYGSPVIPFSLVDLPGYGFAKVPPEQKKLWEDLLQVFFSKTKGPKLVVNVCDARRGIRELDQTLEEYVQDKAQGFLRIFNKADTLNQKERHQLQGQLLLSGKEQKGLDEFKNIIEAFLGEFKKL